MRDEIISYFECSSVGFKVYRVGVVLCFIGFVGCVVVVSVVGVYVMC